MSKSTADLLFAIALATVAASAAAAQTSTPNIVVILVDDLRAGAIGADGHPFVATPNIDRIASEGIRFRNAFVSTPLCSPSRASYFSGLNGRNHQIKGNAEGSGSVSDITLWTWARGLQQQGYRTGHVGKWHMDPTSAPRFGFEYWVGFNGQSTHTDPLLNVNGISTPTSGYTTDILTDYAIQFIQSDHGGRPFALSLAYKAVHEPFPTDDSNLPVQYRGLYTNNTLVYAPTALSSYTLAGKPMLLNPPAGLSPPVPGTTGLGANQIKNQLGQLTYLDASIGRVLDALTQAGILNDTVVVFASDNGFFWREHGLSDKRAPYEEAIRVPLLMRYPPRITAGSLSDSLVEVLDVGPTLLDLAAAPIPSFVEGLSLTPVLANPATAVRDRLFFEYWYESTFPRIPDWKALRDANWKYITYPGLGPTYDELYQLSTDPYEMINRIADPAAATVREEMKRSLASVEQSLIHEPVEVVVPGSTLDYEITKTGGFRFNSIIATAGSRSTSPAGGRAAVIVFPVPPLAPGQTIVAASPVVIPATSLDRHVPSTTHVDVWLLQIGSSTPISAYLESDVDPDPQHVKLDEDVLWWDRAYGAVEIDPDGAALLAQHLMNFYAANPGYNGGSYLSLRYNADADTGNGDAGWDVITAEHSTPGLRPALKLRIASPDTDLDGLSDLREQQLGTSPTDPDTDDDGLSDGVENGGGIFVNASLTGTSPLLADTDADGLSDGAEINTYGTDPFDPDSDDDGVSDGAEVAAGTDPLDAGRSPVVPDLATVGAEGNPADATGFGAVAYPYEIGRFEVTVREYVSFLNAVAASDPNGLFHEGGDPNYSILRTGTSGSYSYAALAGRQEMPVNFVSLYDAMRFVNWLTNDQPQGAQDETTTEDGAYSITPAGVQSNSITRQANAAFVLPTEDEWYKAAYYDPLGQEYFAYPTGSSSATACSATYSMPEAANCDGATGGLTPVGSYTQAPSLTDTFDQGGDVWEWTETRNGQSRRMRGGAFDTAPSTLSVADSGLDVDPAAESADLGFRVVMLPEAGRFGSLLAGIAVLFALGRARTYPVQRRGLVERSRRCVGVGAPSPLPHPIRPSRTSARDSRSVSAIDWLVARANASVISVNSSV